MRRRCTDTRQVAFQVFHEGRLALRLFGQRAGRADVRSRRRFQRPACARSTGGSAPWRVFATYGAERDIQVYVAEEIASRSSIVWAVVRSTAWPMAVALPPLLMLAAWWAIRRGPAPLRRLGATLANGSRRRCGRLPSIVRLRRWRRSSTR